MSGRIKSKSGTHKRECNKSLFITLNAFPLGLWCLIVKNLFHSEKNSRLAHEIRLESITYFNIWDTGWWSLEQADEAINLWRGVWVGGDELVSAAWRILFWDITLKICGLLGVFITFRVSPTPHMIVCICWVMSVFKCWFASGKVSKERVEKIVTWVQHLFGYNGREVGRVNMIAGIIYTSKLGIQTGGFLMVAKWFMLTSHNVFVWSQCTKWNFVVNTYISLNTLTI